MRIFAEKMDSEKIITIHTFTFAHEVAIVRGRLESEGIPCFAQDELTLQVSPFHSNTIGGVKLQVLESNVPRAIQILKEAGYIRDEQISPKVKKEKRNAEMIDREVRCPYCGSDEVKAVKKGGWLFLLTSLPFLAPSPFLKRNYHCFDCQQEFGLSKHRK